MHAGKWYQGLIRCEAWLSHLELDCAMPGLGALSSDCLRQKNFTTLYRYDQRGPADPGREL